ncbi:MAG: hypothetical protein KF718_05875 [Polyangiaceae bacterium]|nr:hypothetical protein [Polyangiaceae bacterium]
MWSAWSDVRAGERRVTLLAFATLFGIMAGHSLVETSRDALFLARLPATHLPLVYLGVAAVAWGIARFEPELRAKNVASALTRTLVVAALVTAGFWLSLPSLGAAGLYALYLWSAIIASLAVAGFWLTLSERVTVTQAKRLYAVVGTGSVLGATFGTAAAGLIAAAMPARHLLLAAALLLGLSALGPVRLAREVTQVVTTRAEEDASAQLAELGKSPYVVRVALLALLAAVTFTLVDYTFKSQVAAAIAPERLGVFLAQTYLALNVASLAVQLLLVQRTVQRLGVTGALALLPALLVLGGVGVAAVAGLATALVLKGADGALRHSLHRTSVELLYVPMEDRSRTKAKTLIDVLVQRAGQALGSVLILALLAVGAGPRVLGIAIALCATLWVVLALDLRQHFLNLFRRTLESSAHRRAVFPELDLSSLEAVIASLNSQNDRQVVAALDYLELEGKSRLVPSLILYHPSEAVVVHALALLARAGRADVTPLARRLVGHADATVRAAALRALSKLDPRREELMGYLDAGCPCLRATALVGLASRSWLDADETGRRVDALFDAGSPVGLLALAEAIAVTPSPTFQSLLVRLGQRPELEVRRAALAAMTAAPSEEYLDILIQMLERRELRAEARATLLAIGDPALERLSAALDDEDLPVTVRRHVPRTLMRFEAGRAAPILLSRMEREDDGIVRYKLLRALGRLQRNEPHLRHDRELLDELIARTARRMYGLVAYAHVLQDGARSEGQRSTDAQRLLLQLLLDKLAHGIERLFRLLGLRYPREDWAAMYRGLASRRPAVRASTRELLDGVLPSPLREAVLGLLDDVPAPERLAQAGPFAPPAAPSYEAVLRELVATKSESLRSLAAYHAGELGLLELRPAIEAAADVETAPTSRRLTAQALELLGAGPEIVEV